MLRDPNIVGPKNKYDATADPTVSDDQTQGYAIGSQWINTTTDKLFTCVDAATGAAIWINGGGIAVNTVDPTVNDDDTKGFSVGNLWLNTTTEVLWMCLAATTGAAVWKETTGPGAGLARTGNLLDVNPDARTVGINADNKVVAATLTKVDREHTPGTTSGDDQDTGITITLTPAGKGTGTLGDRAVVVKVRGLGASIGDGVKTEACFFSASASAPYTAKFLADIAVGDKLIWNGDIAEYDLDGDDVVGLMYETLDILGPGAAVWGVGIWGDFMWV